ncbi:MAG: efflux RND transporter periplasmic adaptor subunit [Planctomycetota bacterium]|jgi:multidrug efflux pump subunit AcrA (membrane-fusion protein)
MATTSRGEKVSASDLLETLAPTEGIDVAAPPRRGRFEQWAVRGVVLATVVGLAAGAYAMLAGTLEGGADRAMRTHTVKPGPLLVTITEDGNLESANNVDIKCEVAGGSTILWIVEDGRSVEKGEKLAELDSSKLEDEINAQKITLEKARATYIQAEKDFSVAKISVQEYIEGIYRKEIQDLEAQITIAMENLRSSQNMLQHTEKMFRKGYVSPLQLETQQFAVERAKIELESAETAKDVLERFTKAKTLEDLHSKRDVAEARMNSEKAAFELEEARLKRSEAQLEKCLIMAPQSGMAVYANETGRMRMGSQQPQVEEGAMVRERQTIFRLPDLSQMQVKVAVHESKVDQLRIGMKAWIRILDRSFRGHVLSIANQPEQTGWFTANVKEYATIVRIDKEVKETESGEIVEIEEQPTGLKPGMTAEVEIRVADLKDVLMLPVATVVENRGKFFCWVNTPNGPERRPLVLGMSNDEYVEVKDGVKARDEVILNPRAVVAEAREEDERSGAGDADKKFGAPSGDEPTGDGQQPGGRLQGGPAAKSPPGGAPSSAGPDAAGRRGGPGGHGGPGGGEGRGPGSGRSLMDNDKDGDGKVSRDEAPERMRDFFDRLDSNGDGFIDSAEIEEMRSRFGRGSGGGPPGGGSGRGRGGPGGGPPGGGGPP